jgi:hypothetical protein
MDSMSCLYSIQKNECGCVSLPCHIDSDVVCVSTRVYFRKKKFDVTYINVCQLSILKIAFTPLQPIIRFGLMR